MSDYLLCRFDGLGSILKVQIKHTRATVARLCTMQTFYFKCSREIYEIFISVLYKVINVSEVNMQICKNKET